MAELTAAFRADAIPELPDWLAEMLEPGRHEINSPRFKPHPARIPETRTARCAGTG